MQNILKMRTVLEELPPFCKEFFRGIEQYTSTRTRLAYAYDLRMFFEFLHEKNSACAKLEISRIPLTYLDLLNRQDIEEYLEYVSLYQKDGKNIINEERGKSRKLASLRSFYNYFFETEKIKKNPAALVPLPKQHDKEIIRLEPNEVAILLDQVEDGSKLTKKEQEYHKKTKLRDVALITLLLGTGIRVSECVGLDLQDVDFDVYGIRILRKGGKEAIIYFGEEVGTALLDYLEQREHMVPAEGHENALFLSLQNRRMAVRSVENLVKKYASRVTTLKKITPHKLRSTYGTALYRETGDIYLVADVLGHSDVNTTRKHYAAQEDEAPGRKCRTAQGIKRPLFYKLRRIIGKDQIVTGTDFFSRQMVHTHNFGNILILTGIVRFIRIFICQRPKGIAWGDLDAGIIFIRYVSQLRIGIG